MTGRRPPSRLLRISIIVAIVLIVAVVVTMSAFRSAILGGFPEKVEGPARTVAPSAESLRRAEAVLAAGGGSAVEIETLDAIAYIALENAVAEGRAGTESSVQIAIGDRGIELDLIVELPAGTTTLFAGLPLDLTGRFLTLRAVGTVDIHDGSLERIAFAEWRYGSFPEGAIDDELRDRLVEQFRARPDAHRVILDALEAIDALRLDVDRVEIGLR